MRRVKLGFFVEKMPSFYGDPTEMPIGMRSAGFRIEREQLKTSRLDYYYIDNGRKVRLANPSIFEKLVARWGYINNHKRHTIVGGRNECPLE